MKMKLLSWDKARAAYKIYTGVTARPNTICGIGEHNIPWGREVETTAYNDKYYELDCFLVPAYCFKGESYLSNDALRYGTILTDDEFYETPNEASPKTLRYVRIRIIAYNGIIYYHKMLNGEIVEFKKVGVEE